MHQKHLFHLVAPSPYPLGAALSTLALTLSLVLVMHDYENALMPFFLSICSLILIASMWWESVIYEAIYEGAHTSIVQTGLKLGFILFIVSEVMFFFAFFWAFFHSSLAPAIEIGAIWPPYFIQPFNPFSIPLQNTLILLLSGATITVVHYSIIVSSARDINYGFLYTIYLACWFLLLQAYEYIEAPFTISDGIYGSTFFMATGFHGLHVMIGTIFILVCYIRYHLNHFTIEHHVGFESAVWYWHFVDVVWLFLYISIYYWGSR